MTCLLPTTITIICIISTWNKDRTKLDLKDDLVDKIANNNEELAGTVFGRGFGVITDIESGPDGFLYLLSHTNGTIYRVVPKSNT